MAASRCDSSMRDVFVTGATGFLGRQIARRLLVRPDVRRLYCLVRAQSEGEGRKRLLDSLGRVLSPDEMASFGDALVAVPGDLTSEGLGISSSLRAAIVRDCRVFLHCAADVRFNLDLDEARSRNLGGTKRVVELAMEAHTLERFDWVGTAFVAGKRRDRVWENDLNHQAGWKNSYEQSKYEAEVWLRAQGDELPLTVFRPSIIVGESTTGKTSNYGVLYWPVRVYARGWWRTVVGRPDTPIDVVPVDYVADAVVALSGPSQAVGGTYHLAAGPGGSLTIAELGLLLKDYFNGPNLRYIDKEFFMRWIRPFLDLFLWGKRGRVLKQGGRFFVPYFDGNPIFEVDRTQASLGPLGLHPPRVEHYITNLLDYCVATDFGRRAMPSIPGQIHSSTDT